MSEVTQQEVNEAMRDLGIGKSCYIAGPMTGLPHLNFGSFLGAAEVLRKDGYDVRCPATYALQSGFDPRSNDAPTAELMEKMRRWDIEQVLSVDEVWALHGWMMSKGAVAEVALAQWRGIPVKQCIVQVGADATIKFGIGPDAPLIVEITGVVGRSGVNL